MVTKINLAEKFGRFTDQWSPQIIADLNDSHVKLAKVQGEFVWHQHADEVQLMLIEPKAIRRIGDVESAMTVHQLARI